MLINEIFYDQIGLTQWKPTTPLYFWHISWRVNQILIVNFHYFFLPISEINDGNYRSNTHGLQYRTGKTRPYLITHQDTNRPTHRFRGTSAIML